MNTFSIAGSFRYGWEKTKQNFWVCFLVLFSFLALNVVFSEVTNDTKHMFLLGAVVFALTLLASIALRIGLTQYFLDASEGHGAYETLFSLRSDYIAYFIATVLLGVLILLGVFLLVIPGIILLIIYIFVPIVIIDQNVGVGEAFRMSATMTRGSRWHLFCFVFVTALFNMIGVALFGIGVFITLPISAFAGIHIYKTLLNREIPMVRGETEPEAETL